MKHHPIVFAIGERTPVVSISLDPYYNLKNRGVLDNIGHGFNAADRDSFFSQDILTLIDNAFLNIDQYNVACLDYLSRQRQLELKPYTLIGFRS
jgi:hypothetical protein